MSFIHVFTYHAPNAYCGRAWRRALEMQKSSRCGDSLSKGGHASAKSHWGKYKRASSQGPALSFPSPTLQRKQYSLGDIITAFWKLSNNAIIKQQHQTTMRRLSQPHTVPCLMSNTSSKWLEFRRQYRTHCTFKDGRMWVSIGKPGIQARDTAGDTGGGMEAEEAPDRGAWRWREDPGGVGCKMEKWVGLYTAKYEDLWTPAKRPSCGEWAAPGGKRISAQRLGLAVEVAPGLLNSGSRWRGSEPTWSQWERWGRGGTGAYSRHSFNCVCSLCSVLCRGVEQSLSSWVWKRETNGTSGAQCGRVSVRLRFLGFYLHELALQQNANT